MNKDTLREEIAADEGVKKIAMVSILSICAASDYLRLALVRW